MGKEIPENKDIVNNAGPSGMKFVVFGDGGLIGSKLVNKFHHLGDAEVIHRFAQTHDEGAFNEAANSYGDRIYRTAPH